MKLNRVVAVLLSLKNHATDSANSHPWSSPVERITRPCMSEIPTRKAGSQSRQTQTPASIPAPVATLMAASSNEKSTRAFRPRSVSRLVSLTCRTSPGRQARVPSIPALHLALRDTSPSLSSRSEGASERLVQDEGKMKIEYEREFTSPADQRRTW